jgi:hypothetical protein
MILLATPSPRCGVAALVALVGVLRVGEAQSRPWFSTSVSNALRSCSAVAGGLRLGSTSCILQTCARTSMLQHPPTNPAWLWGLPTLRSPHCPAYRRSAACIMLPMLGVGAPQRRRPARFAKTEPTNPLFILVRIRRRRDGTNCHLQAAAFIRYNKAHFVATNTDACGCVAGLDGRW